MKDKYPFVSVVWNDAWADGTETLNEGETDTNHQPTVMETRGWLIGDTPAGVSIWNERCLDEGAEAYRSRTFVPRAMVRSITEWKLVKPKKPKPEVPLPPIAPTS